MPKHHTILVGTQDGLYEIDHDRRIQLAGHEVRSLVNDSGTLWCVIDRRQVWRCGSDGVWNQVASIKNKTLNCLLPTANGLFVGAAEPRLFTLSDKSLKQIPSFSKVQGQEDWYSPGDGPPEVRSMNADPSGRIYVNVHVGGIVCSPDSGRSWKPTIDVDADVHQVLFDEASGVLVAASALGLAISEDDGESWRFDTDGLHDTYLRAVTIASGTIVVSASTGPFTKRAAIYRKSLNNHGPFKRCSRGLPEWFPDNINTFCLAALGSQFAFGTSDGSVFHSPDQGRRWRKVAENLPVVRCIALA